MAEMQQCPTQRTDAENRRPGGGRYYEQSEKESGEYRESGRSGFLNVAENRGKYRSSTLDLRIGNALVGEIR